MRAVGIWKVENEKLIFFIYSKGLIENNSFWFWEFSRSMSNSDLCFHARSIMRFNAFGGKYHCITPNVSIFMIAFIRYSKRENVEDCGLSKTLKLLYQKIWIFEPFDHYTINGLWFVNL